MTTVIRYVIDTHAIIWYFAEHFGQSNENSGRVNRIVDEVLNDPFTSKRLVVPSVVFIEIFDKFCRTANDSRRIFTECFSPLNDSNNVEIREADKEVLNSLLEIGHNLSSHEVNDKIVVATGQVLDGVVITKDPEIHKYAKETDLVEVCW